MKKSKPSYAIGTKLYHASKQKWGTVEAVFDSDGDGWRYYVRHSGYTWSVPEHALTAKPARATAQNRL